MFSHLVTSVVAQCYRLYCKGVVIMTDITHNHLTTFILYQIEPDNEIWSLTQILKTGARICDPRVRCLIAVVSAEASQATGARAVRGVDAVAAGRGEGGDEADRWARLQVRDRMHENI